LPYQITIGLLFQIKAQLPRARSSIAGKLADRTTPIAFGTHPSNGVVKVCSRRFFGSDAMACERPRLEAKPKASNVDRRATNLFPPILKTRRHQAEAQQTQVDDRRSSHLLTTCYAYQIR
jgi:hypothetical protein